MFHAFNCSNLSSYCCYLTYHTVIELCKSVKLLHLKKTKKTKHGIKVGLKHCLLLTTYYVVYTLIREDWTHTRTPTHAHTREGGAWPAN